MNNYYYACVVDAGGIYKDFVLITGSGVYGYTPGDGEQLIKRACPAIRSHAGASGLIRPRWNGTAWEEAATPEEIAIWSANNPAPAPEPTADELINALLGVEA